MTSIDVRFRRLKCTQNPYTSSIYQPIFFIYILSLFINFFKCTCLQFSTIPVLYWANFVSVVFTFFYWQSTRDNAANKGQPSWLSLINHIFIYFR